MSESLIVFDDEKKRLIKETLGAKKFTDLEFSLFINMAQSRGLDPLKQQIYAVKYGDRVTFITSIDGFRLIAERTGKYAGSDDAVFEFEEDRIISATVTVWKMVEGQKCGFTATAFWDEYYPSNPNNRRIWDQRPRGQLSKCAEALALRKGFPNDLSGLYSQDEMHQAERTTAPSPDTDENRDPEIKNKTCSRCGNEMMVSKYNSNELYCNPKRNGCGAKRFIDAAKVLPRLARAQSVFAADREGYEEEKSDYNATGRAENPPPPSEEDRIPF